MPRKSVAVKRTRKVTQITSKEIGHRNVRGKKGGLKDMPTMPLDVLLEIFYLLEPRDLLNLARATKLLREFLMSRRSSSVWKAARANVEGLPDCPSHLSEPAYANLMFFHYCHNCLKPNIQTVILEFSKRYCPVCAKLFTIALLEMRRDIRYEWAYLHIDIGVFSKIYVSGQYTVYHCPELDEIKPIWERLRYDHKEWYRFAAERKLRFEAIEEHASLCRTWDVRRTTGRLKELHNIRQERLNMIVSKLRELGWGEELDRISTGGYHPLCDRPDVRAPKPLTDRVWLKIKDEIIAQMEEMRRTASTLSAAS